MENIEKIFDTANKALASLKYVNIFKAFELRKFVWINGNNIIELITNYSCDEIQITIKKS